MTAAHILLLILVSIAVLGWAVAIIVVAVGTVGGILDMRRYWRDLLDLRRRREGLCIRCGYDLRGTPARCPECGNLACMHPRRSAA